MGQIMAEQQDNKGLGIMGGNRRDETAAEMTARRRKKNKRRRIGLVIAALAVAGLLIFLLRREQKALPKVMTEAVKRGTVTETIGLSPLLKPERIQIVSGTDVKIKELYVEIGDHVKQRDPLLRFDTSELEAELEKTQDLIAKTKDSIAEAAAEAEKLGSQLGALGGLDLDRQIARISRTLSGSLSGLAAQMVDIQAPFLELGKALGTIDTTVINQWLKDMQEIASELRQALDKLEQSGFVDDLLTSIQNLQQIEKQLQKLLKELEGNPSPDFTWPNFTLPGGSMPSLSQSDATGNQTETTSTPTSDSNTESNAKTNGTGETTKTDGSGGAGTPDLSSLSPEMMQQLQQLLGGTSNLSLLSDSLTQGQDLLEQLEEAERSQQEIIHRLNKDVIADFDGILVKVDAAAGDKVASGRDIIRVYDNINLKTVTSVGHNDARRLAKGQKVRYTLENMTFEGEITFIDPVAYEGTDSSLGYDLSTQMGGDILGFGSLMGTSSLSGIDLGTEPQVRVEMSIEGTDLPELIIGFAINAEVETEVRENVLTVSAFSLLKEKGSYYLFVVGDDQILERREVEVGLESSLSVEILSGIKENELVVLSPGANLEAGMTVEASVYKDNPNKQ
ncbi:MAG: HlyD family efflux transporter periplasmic adaptor subunit [Clostridiales bacterium]|nr:HlyD family efflux transporter periplasmic adaptor subunit [Clostridiales bacterium]